MESLVNRRDGATSIQVLLFRVMYMADQQVDTTYEEWDCVIRRRNMNMTAQGCVRTQASLRRDAGTQERRDAGAYQQHTSPIHWMFDNS